MQYLLSNQLKWCQNDVKILGNSYFPANIIVGGNNMKVNYDDAFLEILDRLIDSGLDKDEACLLMAAFLQQQKEFERYVPTLPN